MPRKCNPQFLLRRFESVNQNEAENLLRQRGGSDVRDEISANAGAQQYAKDSRTQNAQDTAEHHSDDSTKARQSTYNKVTSTEEHDYADDNTTRELNYEVKDLEMTQTEIQNAAEEKIKSIGETEKSTRRRENTKREEDEKAAIERQLKADLAKNQEEIEKLKAKIEATRTQKKSTATGDRNSSSAKAYHDKNSDTPLHPYHLPVDQSSAKNGDATLSTQAKTSREHYAHKHVPTLLDAVEQKRKELFRSQELIDYGSILVISNGSYVITRVTDARDYNAVASCFPAADASRAHNRLKLT